MLRKLLYPFFYSSIIKTFEREVAPLLRLKENYPKVLITLDEENESDYQGIRIVSASDFLLHRESPRL